MTLGCAILVVGLLFVSPGVAAAPPPNDNLADATEMTGLPAEATGSNVDATLELGEPTAGSHSIWFKWTAPRDAGVTLALSGCGPPFQDTVQSGLGVAIFIMSPAFGLVPAQLTFRAEAGRVYFIAITSYFGGLPDPDICVRLLPGPPNDDFADATPLTGFPVGATYESASDLAPSTGEPGEPDHAGNQTQTGSVWYSWTASADLPVVLRVCGDFEALAIYTGERVDALRWVLTRGSRPPGCGGRGGASASFNAIAGEIYRIAVARPGDLQVLIGTQLAVLAGDTPAFLYTAFPGQTDKLKLRLAGAGPKRALLVETAGVIAANGCEAAGAAGELRCPVSGRTAIAVDVDLGDANDSADVDLGGSGVAPDGGAPVREVSGGDGNDALAGSAGAYRWDNWTGGLSLIGGRGADSIVGGRGDESIRGGPEADAINPRGGSDAVNGGSGADRVRSVDGASDRISCDGGRDYVRLDGVDLSRGCERRRLSSPARAVPTAAVLSNDDGEDSDHLKIFIDCPVDARRGCATKIVAAVKPHRTITRRRRLPPGGSSMVQTYTFSEEVLDRGVRVTASTHRPGARALKFTRRLPVFDERYQGEG